ncbi:MAG: NAD-dependent epimerase/dehydratase family protein [Planctomycetes bacterium]|nr:NAD-dependent epimerase/dehydratase family protein [Planctomycetota bacterium]
MDPAVRKLAALPAGAPVLVTGGAGFIGSHLTAALLRRGHPVHVLDDLSTGSLDNIAPLRQLPGFRLTVGSAADPEIAAACVADAAAVFHLAGMVGVRLLAATPVVVMERNLRCTDVMLRVCAEAARPTLITSSSEVYGHGPVPFRESDPVRPGVPDGLRGGYACAKAMGEWLAMAHAHEHRLPVVVARLFNTVGPRQPGDAGMVLPRFVAQAVRGEPITVYGDGSQTRCFAHVEEVAVALIDLLANPAAHGAICNVGSDREVSVLALANLVRDVAGSRSPVELVPFAEVFPRGFGDPPRRVPCLSRLRALTGRAPERPIGEIVRELVVAARQELALPV